MNMLTLISQATEANFGGGFKPPTDAISDRVVEDATGVAAAANLESFISSIVGAMTIIAGLFFIFYFVMGGLNWVTAGGEAGKVSKARDQMVQAVIGMVVIVISYGLIGVIGRFLGIDLLRPGAAIIDLVKNR